MDTLFDYIENQPEGREKADLVQEYAMKYVCDTTLPKVDRNLRTRKAPNKTQSLDEPKISIMSGSYNRSGAVDYAYEYVYDYNDNYKPMEADFTGKGVYLLLKRNIFVAITITVFTIAAVVVNYKYHSHVDTTLQVTPSVKIYFSSDAAHYLYPRGERPNKARHRFVEYNLIVENIGNETITKILGKVELDPQFEELVKNRAEMNIPLTLKPSHRVKLGYIYFVEGKPEKIEELARLNKVALTWEQGGSKYIKNIPLK